LACYCHTLGRARKTTHRVASGRLLMEQMITRDRFNGPFSILPRTPPMDSGEVARCK
jgi:hypothetical protein